MSKMTNQQIIEHIEGLLIQLKDSLNLPSKKSSLAKEVNRSTKQDRGFSGLTGNIYELLKEGFFDQSKTISDLQKKLKDRGIKKPTTALMPSLKLLIIKKVLDRNKPDRGLYQYFKR